jgi:hypothetical protein
VEIPRPILCGKPTHALADVQGSGFTLPGHPWPRQLALGEGAAPAAPRRAGRRPGGRVTLRGSSAATRPQGRCSTRVAGWRQLQAARRVGRRRCADGVVLDGSIESLSTTRRISVAWEINASFPRWGFGLACGSPSSTFRKGVARALERAQKRATPRPICLQRIVARRRDADMQSAEANVRRQGAGNPGASFTLPGHSSPWKLTLGPVTTFEVVRASYRRVLGSSAGSFRSATSVGTAFIGPWKAATPPGRTTPQARSW